MISLESFSKAKVVVVGDVMLDRYWWGSVSRISPEAPVPVVKLKSTSLAHGGAANVAANIAGLGATPILIGAVGTDSEAELAASIMTELGVSPEHLIRFTGRPTTVKTRIVAHSQQVARIDHEHDEPLSERDEEIVVAAVRDVLDHADALVLSDYAKGLLSPRVLNEVIAAAQAAGRSVLVDPKGKSYGKYRGADLITPNRREAAEACNLEDDGQDLVEVAGRELMSVHSFESVLITQGEEGMTLFRQNLSPLHLNAMAKQVYDVTGAGDTVIATLAAALASGADLETAADIANVAAGLVVQQVGTTPITFDSLMQAMKERNDS